MVDPIKVKGLKDFQAALKRADGESQKQLRLVLNDAANIVVKDAAGLIPRKSGRAAASLKAQSSQREARVKAGSAKAPYYPWLDFGGKVGRGNATQRPFLKEGRYIFPAAKRNDAQIIAGLEKGLSELAGVLDG